jgi:hypothetical protein
MYRSGKYKCIVVGSTRHVKELKRFLQLFYTWNPPTDELVLIQKNGDYEVECSFTKNEVTSSNAI